LGAQIDLAQQRGRETSLRKTELDAANTSEKPCYLHAVL
jgi:hypothetical protein